MRRQQCHHEITELSRRRAYLPFWALPEATINIRTQGGTMSRAARIFDLAAQQASPVSGPVRIAVLGAGSVCDHYLPALAHFPDLDVRVIADRHQDRAQARASQFGIGRSTTIGEAIAADDIEAILNLTPPGAHMEHSLAALAAGKHVYSEKPLTTSPAQANDLVHAAAERELVLGCAPDVFLGPGFQAALRVLNDGEIGEPCFARCEAVLDGPESWHPRPEFLYAKGAGPLFDIGPYYLSAIVAALGPVVSVVARGTRKADHRIIGSGPAAGTEFNVEVDTLTTAILELESGLPATMLLTFDSASHRGGWMEILGQDGTLRTPDPNGSNQNAAVLRSGSDDWIAVPHVGKFQGLGPGVVNFARHIRGTETLVANGQRAAHVVEVMAAIQAAATSGGSVSVTSRFAAPCLLLRVGIPVPQPTDFDANHEHQRRTVSTTRTRQAIVLLSATAMVGALSACTSESSGDSSGSSDVTLSWWAPNLSNSLTEDQEFYEGLVQPFTEETGIEVEIEVNAWGDYYNKILGAITSGEGGDVISTGTTWVSTLSESGGFTQFGDAELEAIGGADQFVDTAYTGAGGDRDGGPSMLPWVTGVTAMWYNPVLFAEAGIDSPPSTWSEFVAAAKALTQDTDGDGEIDQWGFGYPSGFAQEWSHTMFAFGEQNDAPFFTEDGEANLNAPGMAAAARQFTDLITENMVLSPSSVENTGFDRVYADFTAGQLGMLFAPGANAAFDSAGFSDYEIAQIPLNDVITGKPVTTHITGVNLGLFADTPYPDEALQLLRFLSSAETQVALYNGIPTIMPANAKAYDSADLDRNAYFDTSAQILQETAAGYPNHLLTAQAETLIGDAMKEIVAQAATNGGISDEEIMAILDEANSQLAASS
ncbi:MAG: extracellular solute-binding protein [Beutenbergiaceae bacterium]